MDSSISAHQNAFFLFISSPSMWLVLGVFFINFLIATMMTFVTIRLFPIEINKKTESFFWFLVSIGTFIPGFGSIVIFIAIVLLWRFGKDFVAFESNRQSFYEYTRKNPIETVAHGAGWATLRLESTQYSHQERIKALYGIGKSSPKDSNVLYAKLVSDEMEELRVSAFSLLETQQDYLQKKIHELLKAKESINSIAHNAYIAKQLALLYWEIVYRNLSLKEFRSFMIDRSFHFATEACKHLTEDTTLSILLAKIYIEKGELSEAWEKLIEALGKDAPPIKITPYLAEISYLNKDYESVKRWLSFDETLRYFFKLNQITNFWCKK